MENDMENIYAYIDDKPFNKLEKLKKINLIKLQSKQIILKKKNFLILK